MTETLVSAVANLMPTARLLFDKIGSDSRDGEGITRDAFGARETQAAMTMAEFARKEGLETAFDPNGNLHVTLSDQMNVEPEIVIASHLDSVPIGGNYDGLAGVIAGFVVLAALRRAGEMALNIRLLGFRGEESPWFGTAYLGSKLLLGELTPTELKTLRRYDTGKTLAQHIEELRIDLGGTALQSTMSLKRLRAYFELHIEQAPLLENLDQPIGVATAIRGNIRHPVAKCFGSYAHSGAVPRRYRRDALIATAKLIAFADQKWKDLIAEGNDDLVFTCGIFHTDLSKHTMTKVPGEVTFSLNIGGIKNDVMEKFEESLSDEARRLERDHSVRFDFGARVGTPAVALDEALLGLVQEAGRAIGFSPVLMPTVGHDAAMFQRRGIPTSVILVRNTGGSHNPNERMELADFEVGAKVLATAINGLR